MSEEQRWLDRVLTRARVVRFSVAVLAVNLVLYAAMVAKGTFPFDAQGTILLPDFMAHLTGGALLARGEAAKLYDVGAQSAFQVAITGNAKIVDIFISPPIAALLYAPFATLSYGGACVAWTLASLAALALALRLLRRMMPDASRDDVRVFVVAFAASQPVVQLFGSGQDTALSLLIWAAGTYLALRRKDAAAGLVFALGLFKPQLFLFPPLVLLVLGRRRAVVAWVGSAAVVLALTLLVLGKESFTGWWQILHSPQYLVSLRTGRALRMASLGPLVLSIAPDSASAVADVLGKALSAAVAVATIVRVFRSGRGELDERGVWALACVATLIVSPHLFYYDLTLLVVPVALSLDIFRGHPHAYPRAVRDALLAITVLTWTGAARVPFESAGWPLRLLAASWTAVPMLFLWRAIPTRALTARGGTPAMSLPGA